MFKIYRKIYLNIYIPKSQYFPKWWMFYGLKIAQKSKNKSAYTRSLAPGANFLIRNHEFHYYKIDRQIRFCKSHSQNYSRCLKFSTGNTSCALRSFWRRAAFSSSTGQTTLYTASKIWKYSSLLSIVYNHTFNAIIIHRNAFTI